MFRDVVRHQLQRNLQKHGAVNIYLVCKNVIKHVQLYFLT